MVRSVLAPSALLAALLTHVVRLLSSAPVMTCAPGSLRGNGRDPPIKVRADGRTGQIGRGRPELRKPPMSDVETKIRHELCALVAERVENRKYFRRYITFMPFCRWTNLLLVVNYGARQPSEADIIRRLSSAKRIESREARFDRASKPPARNEPDRQLVLDRVLTRAHPDAIQLSTISLPARGRKASQEHASGSNGKRLPVMAPERRRRCSQWLVVAHGIGGVNRPKVSVRSARSRRSGRCG